MSNLKLDSMFYLSLVFERESESTSQRHQFDRRRSTCEIQVNTTRLLKFFIKIFLKIKLNFSEYKRIKKVVFKRQVVRAYEILCGSDQFVKEIEQKLDEYFLNSLF